MFRQTSRLSDAASRTLRHAVVSRDSKATLIVRPTTGVLTTAAAKELLSDLAATGLAKEATRVVFDLAAVTQLGPQWTVVVALLIDFARRIPAACEMVNLSGQPAAVVAMFAGRTQVGAAEMSAAALSAAA